MLNNFFIEVWKVGVLFCELKDVMEMVGGLFVIFCELEVVWNVYMG